MKSRVVMSVCGLALCGCGQSQSSMQYGYVARLGQDTVSVENVTRIGARVIIEGVDRFPRVRRRHAEIQLTAAGGVQSLKMRITTPSEPEGQRDRLVETRVTKDSVHIVKTDAVDTVRRDFATRAMVMAHVPQMYGLYDLYFSAAHRRVKSPKGDDTVWMRQFYVDREFDRFTMHNAFVRLRPNQKAEIWHGWLAGVGEATLDSAGHLISYSGARTTYKVEVERNEGAANVDEIFQRFSAVEANAGGARPLSVRDSTASAIGSATLTVTYGRPLARGRVLLGNIIPYDRVWRTGANEATHFATTAPMTIAGISVPAGQYTLWTVPRRNGGADLIINKQTGQWGTEYDAKQDLSMARMKVDTLTSPVEAFTISIAADGAKRGRLTMEWGTFRWTAPIMLK